MPNSVLPNRLRATADGLYAQLCRLASMGSDNVRGPAIQVQAGMDLAQLTPFLRSRPAVARLIIESLSTLDREQLLQAAAAIAKMTGSPATSIGGDGGDPRRARALGSPIKAMTWQQAMKVAERHCARNPFPGVNALAKIVGCSTATIRKAIDRSVKLRAKLAEHEAQRRSVSAVAMTDRATQSAKQTREPDPIDAASASTDDLFRRLLEQAKPAERAASGNGICPSRPTKTPAKVPSL